MMETSIAEFHIRFKISSIQKLVFQILYVRIIGNNHCSKTSHNAFKRYSAKQYFLCRRHYAERVVASFEHQI